MFKTDNNPKKHPLLSMIHHHLRKTQDLSTLTPDPPGKLDILGHDGHTLSMDCTKVGVFK